MPPLALLIGAITLSSCGGGGGSGPSVPTPTPTATPTATRATSGASYVPSGCDANTYLPNYISSNSGTGDGSGDAGFTYWRHFPISVYIAPVAATTRAATIAGFNEWVTATGGRVSYTLVPSATGADLAISYSPDNQPVDSSGYTTVGLTTVYYEQRVNDILSAQMQLFILEPDGSSNTLSDARGTTQSVAAHEFGHALGIGPHSLVGNDLMYFSLHADNGPEPVTTRDLNTLETIYCNNFPTAASSALKSHSALAGGTLHSRTSPPLLLPKN